MRHRWLRRITLALGLLAGAPAEGFIAPALGADPPTPVIQPWPPTAPRATPPAVEEPAPTLAEAAPAATLDRPVPLRDSGPVEDSEIQPTGLFNRRPVDAGSMYGPIADLNSPRRLPAGPSVDANAPPLPPGALAATPPPDVPYSWKQSPTSTTVTTPLTPPTPIGPMPSTSPPAGVAAGPGIAGAPIGDPVCDGCGVPGCCTPGCGDGGCCGSGCGDGCGCGWGCGGWNRGCCFPNRWYASAEYLLWFIRNQPVPALLTSGSLADAVPGALGQAGTTTLFGGNSLNNNPFSGVRLRGGYWFGDCHGLGLDLGGFILGGGVNRFNASSLGNPFLARPFTNALTGLQDIEAVATPNGLTGSFSSTNSFFLYGAEANLRRNICCGCNWYIDALAGWRLLGLNESLNLQENLAVASSTNPALPAGSTFIVSDRFGTRNLFNGGQVGAIAEYRLGRWIFDLRDTIALGGTQQFVSIGGNTLATVPGQAPVASTGGLLAQTTNIGNHTRGVVSFVEEIGFNVGYQFTNHIRGFIGYNFLYWSSVVRPGRVIDPTVNPNLIPPSTPGGPARPAFNFNATDFWVQGINFGLDFRW